MDAVKFLQERNRMFLSGVATPSIGLEDDFDPVMAVEIAEKWSEQHPRRTRKSVFLEQYPEALVFEGDLCVRVPCFFLPNTGMRTGDAQVLMGSCAECRREFWMQEVE